MNQPPTGVEENKRELYMNQPPTDVEENKRELYMNRPPLGVEEKKGNSMFMNQLLKSEIIH